MGSGSDRRITYWDGVDELREEFGMSKRKIEKSRKCLQCGKEIMSVYPGRCNSCMEHNRIEDSLSHKINLCGFKDDY